MISNDQVVVGCNSVIIITTSCKMVQSFYWVIKCFDIRPLPDKTAFSVNNISGSSSTTKILILLLLVEVEDDTTTSIAIELYNIFKQNDMPNHLLN
jgi:hypothetical protein